LEKEIHLIQGGNIDEEDEIFKWKASKEMND